MKLLIGDDDAASNQEIVKLVQASGHEAVSAATDEEVLKLLSANGKRPNFAILNSSTQNLHGLDICKKFRAAPSLYYTYFVLMNGKSSQEEIMALLEGGADDYLTKPVNPEDLAVRLRAGQRVLQNEEKLTKITQEWKIMLDNLPFGIACLGPEGELRRANRPFFELMGYRDMKAVLNKKLGETVVRFPSDFDELLTNINAAHPFDRVEMDFVKRDSSILKLCIWGRPISLNGVVFELITSLA
ncbi:MAG TPA: response regulator [Terriglobales bacterium]|jgi:CheY-like chemotaxis protein